MIIRIRRSHELGGMCFLWVYDIVKYLVFRSLLESRGIDPLIFLFLDMVTVPLFVIGSARLINSLAGRVMAWQRVLGWGIIVLFNTFLPYIYAAMAGGAQFDTTAWIVFWGLIVLMLANLVRTIQAGVVSRKR